MEKINSLSLRLIITQVSYKNIPEVHKSIIEQQLIN